MARFPSLETDDDLIADRRGGLRLPVTGWMNLAGEVFYSPLSVRRPGLDQTIEGLVNVRGLVELRFN